MTPPTPPPWPSPSHRFDPAAPHPGPEVTDFYEIAHDSAGIAFWRPRPDKWRSIPSTCGVFVASAEGCIRRTDRMEATKLHRSGGGTQMFRAQFEGRVFCTPAAVAVGEAWLGAAPAHHQWRLRDNSAPPALSNIIARPIAETRRSAAIRRAIADGGS